MSKLSSRNVILPIFLTVFIDMLGVGIIIPVLPALFFEQESMIFSPDVTFQTRSLLYGLLLASYPFMQFFGAPILGTLSDRHGRKPLLQISLAGTFLGYLVFGYAVASQNIPLLFISRMLPGFTGGNISIVFSAIADVSDDSSKARNFGLVGMAFGLGFILGPTLGGILADPTMVSWFTPATPFLFTAGLTLINILLVQYNFKETLVERRQAAVNIFKGVGNIARSFRAPNLRVIFTVVLFTSLGFTFFTQFFSVLLIEKIGVRIKDVGLLFGWIGLWLVITQGVTVRILSRKYASATVLRVSLLMLSIAVAAVMLPSALWMFYLVNPFIATFQGITSPNLTAVVSSQVARDQQGEILGINQSMQSLGQILPALIGSYLNTIDVHVPLMAASGFILLGWIVYMLVFQPRQKGQPSAVEMVE
ncbi:MAG: MFS transporter [Saprospiraceae bacterium]